MQWWCCEFESLSGRNVCDTVCHWLATGLWFSPGPPVPSTNNADRHDITEILLKVALNTIKQTNFPLLPQNLYRTWVIRLVSHTKQKLHTLREHVKLTPGLLVESLLLIFLVFRVSGIQNWLYVWDLKALFFNLRCSIFWF
jgi:hypothetical protein